MQIIHNAELSIHIVSASRCSPEDFAQESLLGRCLTRPEHKAYKSTIHCSNHESLAITYNSAIESSPPTTVLVFCHDDVDLGAEHLGSQLQEALARFDVVGVCGNQRHQSGQVARWLGPSSGQWVHAYLGSPEKVNLESASKKETRLSPQPDHHAAAI